ncbi:MAG: transcriptional regulator [Caldilineaceae bacterium]|nr:transcriptional regulator [Caldilineaceae bacterium]
MTSDTIHEPEVDIELEKLVHEPARLKILAYLYAVDSADFVFLIRRTGLTMGNLSAHMSKLEQAGYIDVEKEIKDNRPRTMLSLTDAGRSAFTQYRDSMLRLLQE